MANKIEIDITKLGSDLSQLTNLKKTASTNMDELVAAIQALNATWEGTAHDTFLSEFTSDQSKMEEALSALEEFLQAVEYAQQEYSKCEQNVGSLVDGIRV